MGINLRIQIWLPHKEYSIFWHNIWCAHTCYIGTFVSKLWCVCINALACTMSTDRNKHTNTKYGDCTGCMQLAKLAKKTKWKYLAYWDWRTPLLISGNKTMSQFRWSPKCKILFHYGCSYTLYTSSTSRTIFRYLVKLYNYFHSQ